MARYSSRVEFCIVYSAKVSFRPKRRAADIANASPTSLEPDNIAVSDDKFVLVGNLKSKDTMQDAPKTQRNAPTI